ILGRLAERWERPDLAQLFFERALELSTREQQTQRELTLLARSTAGDARADERAALQVEIMWDSDYSDVDLHVIEPSGEEVYYSHLASAHGGLLHGDVRNGFGPETYTI